MDSHASYAPPRAPYMEDYWPFLVLNGRLEAQFNQFSLFMATSGHFAYAPGPLSRRSGTKLPARPHFRPGVAIMRNAEHVGVRLVGDSPTWPLWGRTESCWRSRV
jgi:hypothetical protein